MRYLSRASAKPIGQDIIMEAYFWALLSLLGKLRMSVDLRRVFHDFPVDINLK